MRNKIKKFVKSHTKEVIIFGVFIIAIIIYFIAPAFATLIPVKSVVITSENTSYKDSEPGSWQVTKSGKWTGKGEAYQKTLDTVDECVSFRNSKILEVQ